LPGSPGVAADQPQVRLVDQRRGLEALAGLLPGQPLGGEPTQLVVDQGPELLGGPRVAVPDGREDAGDFVHAGRCLGPSTRPAPTTGPGASSPRLGSRDRPGARMPTLQGKTSSRVRLDRSHGTRPGSGRGADLGAAPVLEQISCRVYGRDGLAWRS